MLGLIISIIVIGLIAGALARLVVPGRQDMSILMTIVLGHRRVVRRRLPRLPDLPQGRPGRLPPARRDHRLVHRRGHRAADLRPSRTGATAHGAHAYESTHECGTPTHRPGLGPAGPDRGHEAPHRRVHPRRPRPGGQHLTAQRRAPAPHHRRTRRGRRVERRAPRCGAGRALGRRLLGHDRSRPRHRPSHLPLSPPAARQPSPKVDDVLSHHSVPLGSVWSTTSAPIPRPRRNSG